MSEALTLIRSSVAGNTVLHTPLTARCESKGVILCLAGLSGSKEALGRHRRMAAFAEAGYGVVLCDHHNAGERRDKKLEPLSNIEGWTSCQKDTFWRAIYRTACEVPEVVSWAIHTFQTTDISAYGSSMGGDCYLTSLVFERRLRALVCDRASPDWLRPNSKGNVLGESVEGDALYERHCPSNRLAAFDGHPTAMLFLCGESDEHVPRALAEGFVADLRAARAYVQAERLQVAVLPSRRWLGHIFAEPVDVTLRCLTFLDAVSAPDGDSAAVVALDEDGPAVDEDAAPMACMVAAAAGTENKPPHRTECWARSICSHSSSPRLTA